MSRSRSLYCHSDTGPTGPTALFIRSLWLQITQHGSKPRDNRYTRTRYPLDLVGTSLISSR
jgi:hypothetical protein